MRLLLASLLVFFLSPALSANATFRVTSTLGSSAVLQRDVPATVWGFGTAGASVAATLDGVPAGRTSVGSDGVWRIALPAQPASVAPHTLAFAQTGGGAATLEDVLFGDVYLCGGQSNAQFTLPQAYNAAEEVAAAAHYPNIRVFSAGQVSTPSLFAQPQVDLSFVNLTWSRATVPGAVGGYGNWTTFSAVCWLFGRTLFDSLGGGVPIGLASVNWGGTDIQTWSSPDALAQCQPNPNRNTPGANANSSLWNAKMAPFTTGPTAFAGALYYQGESNAPPFPIFTPGYYACALDALITDWRAKLRAGPAMWFGVVQLAPFTAPAGYGYAEVRAEQLAALRSPNASLSTAADLGDALSPFGTYHPRFKRPVGERLAAAALHHRYGRTDGPAWLHPLATGGTDATAPGSGALAVRIAFAPSSVQGGPLALNASANPCPADTLAGTPPYPYYSHICAAFTAVVGAPAGQPGLPTRYTRLNGTALANGQVLATAALTLPQAQARCHELAGQGCVGFEVASGPPPSDNATVAVFVFRTLADLHVSASATSWASFTPFGTYALPAAAVVAADGLSLLVTAQCGQLCASGQAELRGVTYGWGSWPVATLYAGSGMPALPFYISFSAKGAEGLPVQHAQGPAQPLLQPEGAAAAPPAAAAQPPACSLNGVLQGGVCQCDPGWSGPACRSLSLLPAPPLTPSSQTYLNTSDNSWGISVLPDDSGALFHGYMTNLGNGCALSTYGESSRILHLTSPTLAGPWTVANVALPAFAHNPQVVRDIDGAWLLFHIGAAWPAYCNITCPPHKAPVVSNSSCFKAQTRAISVARAVSPYGPWQTANFILPNPSNTTNPSAYVFPNGTILVTARRWTSGVPLFSAPKWDGPYTALGLFPVTPVPAPTLAAAVAAAPSPSPAPPAPEDTSFDEDPYLYRDLRGGWHMLTHRQPAGTNCPPTGGSDDCRCGGGHLYAESAFGPWYNDLAMVFNCSLAVEGSGGLVTLHARQRPTLTFHTGSRCFTLFTGASTDPVSQYYSSFTMRQEVQC